MRARDSNSAPGTLRKVTSRRRRHNTAKGWVRDRLMRPVLSTTGAVRLEDVKGETLMVQIATKSMLLNVKTARRIVDECVSARRRELIAEAKEGEGRRNGGKCGGAGGERAVRSRFEWAGAGERSSVGAALAGFRASGFGRLPGRKSLRVRLRSRRWRARARRPPSSHSRPSGTGPTPDLRDATPWPSASRSEKPDPPGLDVVHRADQPQLRAPELGLRLGRG